MKPEEKPKDFTDREIYLLRKWAFVVMIIGIVVAIIFLYRIIKYQDTVLKDPCSLCMEAGYQCIQNNTLFAPSSIFAP